MTRPEVVWRRTGAGEIELRLARLAMPVRMRQLMRLIDGQRNESELQRLLAHPELDALLAQLAEQRLIRRIDDDSPWPAGRFPYPAAGSHGQAAAAPPSRPPPGGAVPDSTLDALAMAQDVTDAYGADSLEQTRARMITALRELTGDLSQPIADRLQRCTAIRELRELLPATLSIVEAIAGQSATHDFLERAGRI